MIQQERDLIAEHEHLLYLLQNARQRAAVEARGGTGRPTLETTETIFKYERELNIINRLIAKGEFF